MKQCPYGDRLALLAQLEVTHGLGGAGRAHCRRVLDRAPRAAILLTTSMTASAPTSR